MKSWELLSKIIAGLLSRNCNCSAKSILLFRATDYSRYLINSGA
jgi:hypothetical protein